MDKIEIEPVDHEDNLVYMKPFEEHRITEVVSLTYVPDNTPGSGFDCYKLKVRVTR